MKPFILIWNHKYLQEKTKELFPQGQFYTQENIIKQAKKFNLNIPIFILAEIFDSHEPSDFYGFEILKEIRLIHKSTAPIIILSFLSKDYFLKKNTQPIFNILKTPGHYFERLPVDLTKITNKNYASIDDDTLHDINTHFFFNEGIIDEAFHNLKNKLIFNLTSSSKEQIFAKIKLAIEHTFSQFLKGLDIPEDRQLDEILKKLLHEIEKEVLINEKIDKNLSIIENYVGEVKRLLPPTKKEEKDILFFDKISWKILFVDDDVEVALRFQKLFEKNNITCLIAHNANDAFNTLKQDKNNDITVLICDYRLLKEDNTWQRIQGYNILKEVFLNFDNEVALFSLTSFNKRTLLKIQKFHKMQVWSYAKDDILGNDQSKIGFNFFIEKVIQEGNRVFEFKRSQPKATSWVKGYDKKFDRPLKDYYRIHRLSKDYETATDFLRKTATEIFNTIKNAKHGNVQGIILEIPTIQENIGKDKKKIQTEAEKLERFRDKLLGRKIAIALHNKLEMSKGQIFNIMKRNHFTLKEPQESDNAINQYFTTYMALSLEKDITKNLLPEERNWLENLLNTTEYE